MNCPTCDYRFDLIKTFDGSQTDLKPGDVSLCMNCAQILEFDSQLTPHKLDDEDAPVTILLYKLQLLRRLEQRRRVV